MISEDVLAERANKLIHRLAEGCSQKYGFSSMSPAVYDTAWVALIQKQIDGRLRWLFPECFQFLLESQHEDGVFGCSVSDVDVILNTMAALFALLRHTQSPLSADSYPSDIQLRITRSKEALNIRLASWDVETSDHVGFEILIPAMLQFLEKEGIVFEFPQRQQLLALSRKKLAKFSPQILYDQQATTLVHSLEAFIGQIDFDLIAHHKSHGSMMASPSSTAAYLMNSSTWDDEAEEYLRNVICLGEGKGRGSVPSAFPITIFEISWGLSILLNQGNKFKISQQDELKAISKFLEEVLLVQDGLVGFAPGLLADADDTAKTIYTLSLLGRQISVDRMIMEFGTNDHFKTYKSERNSSFSANCNILLALLHTTDVEMYAPCILKIVKFLCSSWSTTQLKDKWNLSPEYPAMLLAQGLVHLLHIWDRGQLAILSESIIQEEIPRILCQVMVSTLHGQNPNGSWAHAESLEISSYAILTISCLLSLPWLGIVYTQGSNALEKGKRFLEKNQERWGNAEYIWIEKVTYGSPVLSEAYCLAAMNAAQNETQWGLKVKSLVSFTLPALEKYSGFFSKLPLFENQALWALNASIVVGYTFLPKLKRLRLSIFPRDKMEKDRYLDYIPFTWTSCVNLGNPGPGQYSLSNQVIEEMILLSMLNYQVDEYIESIVSKMQSSDLVALKLTIKRLCRQLITPENNGRSRKRRISACEYDLRKPMSLTPPEVAQQSFNEASAPSLVSASLILQKFIEYILSHSKVTQASLTSQNLLRKELADFLLAQIEHEENNAHFALQEYSSSSPLTGVSPPDTTYFDWVRTTSSDRTSCPYSFVFFSCLIDAPHEDCFKGPRQKYLSQALCRHLATMCRQYNDFGSTARDSIERNLNSIDFPEFRHENAVVNDDSSAALGNSQEVESILKTKTAKSKEDLLWLAEYERRCFRLTMSHLDQLIPTKTKRALETFINVTDLYGQIYVVRDIGTQVKK